MNVTAPDSPDVCLIKMIHCYAAWFCQGGFWQGPDYEPVIGWPFGDPERLEVLRCQTWFWGELRVQLHDAVGWAVSGWAVCWRHFSKCAKIWVKCSGKATVVWWMCTRGVPLNPSAYWHTSADSRTSYLSSFDCLNQFEGLPTALYSHQHFNDQHNSVRAREGTTSQQLFFIYIMVCRVSAQLGHIQGDTQ